MRIWTRTHAPTRCHHQVSAVCLRSMWGGAERKHMCAGRRRLRLTRWRTGWRATSALKPVGLIGNRSGFHRILSWSVGSPISFALLNAITAAPTLLISTSISLPVKVTYKPTLNARRLTCMLYSFLT